MRGNFNNIAVALVCMDYDFDARLLIHLAKIYDSVQDKRIILWMQLQPSEDFLQLILKQIEELKFTQMLLLQMGEYPPVIYRMNLHPSPHFVRLRNISSRQWKLFIPNNIDFMGRTAVVATNITRPNSLSYIKIEGKEVFEFARKYNLTLKLRMSNQTDAGSVDIQLSAQFLSKNTLADHLAYVSPFLLASLIIMVPCGRELSLKEVFKQLDFRTWLLAILGMSYPVSRRDTLSLRQLFMAMSIFGMVFSTFFNCKLSALLTKHSHHAQVTNFEELRASGMAVIVDPEVRSFIESDLQADFFRRVVPIAISKPRVERAAMLVALNGSYAYIVFKQNWAHINNYQISKGQKAFCVSPDLGIIENIPMTSVLQKNSIYKWPLSRALTRFHELVFHSIGTKINTIMQSEP
ncbi:uncharacterized protein LOC110187975 [Drosophila serrata]|uniref:uncharacterized protein LOC110187975 n=1 Tax=Drosophila serrata TaxID=7274 RepID=UPI000A1D26E6|nr:uncharacterized protein LOC110187975 [Drosophila serrata]